MDKSKERNYSLDLIRIIAFCSVAGVHFFLKTDFYNTPIEKPVHLIMVIVRTSMLVCVPLFLILTGYLNNKKTLSKKYYSGILKLLITYILVSIPCYFHRQYFTGQAASFKDLILSILDFTAAEYSWYFEMYIGLFLIIPFLNLIYNNLSTKKQKQILLLTFIFITVLPTILNTYNLTDLEWWQSPAQSSSFNKILPYYWSSTFPITYYFIGAYLNEFKPKIKLYKAVPIYLLIVILFGGYCYYRSFNHIFISADYQVWNGFPVMIISVLLFIIIIIINMNNINDGLKIILGRISGLTFGAYLISSMVDDLIYNYLSKNATNVLEEQFRYYIPCVAVVIITSYLLSYLINIVVEILIKLFSLIKFKNR